LEVANRVAVLRGGRIEQIGTPEQLYDQPASAFVYDFLGNVNLFHGQAHGGSLKIGDKEFAVTEKSSSSDTLAVAFVRPHDIRISHKPRGQDTLAARFIRCRTAGPSAHLELRRLDNDGWFEVQLSKEQFHELQLKPGDQVYVELQNVRVFPEDYSI
jgi:sulfate transport system ATP-binding protein